MSTGLDQDLRVRLESVGVAPRETLAFLKDLVRIYARNPRMTAEQARESLASTGWAGVELDEPTWQALLESFGGLGPGPSAADDTVEDPEGLRAVLDRVHAERGIDFSHYQRRSLTRRLSKRLAARGIQTFAEYLRVLEKDRDEYQMLLDTLTVTVTRFMRNEAAFSTLRRALASDRELGRTNTVRAWSAGCATGEEPYTLAMLLCELHEAGKVGRPEVLASDIDTVAMESAERGVFDGALLSDLPGAWLERYFTPHPRGFMVNDELRSMVSFKRGDLIKDEPPENMDLAMCRNVMIYFLPAVQARVVGRLAQSLRQGGYLLLGRYEMLLRQSREPFDCLDFDARLYRKKWGEERRLR